VGFIKQDIQMANNHMKRCSMTLVPREMQMETTMPYHSIPLKLAKIKNSDNDKAGKDSGKLDYSSTADGNVKWDSHPGK
jgi:hypothetical protein